MKKKQQRETPKLSLSLLFISCAQRLAFSKLRTSTSSVIYVGVISGSFKNFTSASLHHHQ
ncbi:hypothetical protein CIPAW_05G229800 [Carya illinoinensis]|uniref:Uncharacterized protein n=1 Tax=Carya illinoinensis TaxID=32201 RepID=A0A8T1PZF0_CARIL|nr:hypothetical protein CIPAW_07G036000 [Carya illinoinensis]KAG6646841.1 hypothetical protein CIPAW_07G036000 [Carya illinoinensis]KAG6655625.1 hypothetical protein CIPAW_05G229800 [Carya illinoinensis]KAG6655626.1 hypothetical protein CIPAW_05G229800 [Carya illinoinensis]